MQPELDQEIQGIRRRITRIRADVEKFREQDAVLREDIEKAQVGLDQIGKEFEESL